MPQQNRDDARFFFYRPLYVTERGLIVGLATTKEQMRDGLAIAQIARFFPLPEYEGIVVEPGRKSLRSDRNLILVGWAWLFIDPESHQVSGREAPARVGKKKLERIERLYKRCCFQIIDEKAYRVVVNTVTGARFEPSRANRQKPKGHEVDYGVIRRWFRNPAENTLSFEGLHRLGTLAATKVGTDLVYLDVFLEALGKLVDYDDSLPLEILVKAEFDHDVGDIYSMDDIVATPLALVYNGQYVYDLIDGHGEWHELKVPSLNGAISLTLKPGCTPEGVLKVRGRGMPVKGGGRGDLIIKYSLATPEKLGRKHLSILKRLEATDGFSPQLDSKGWCRRKDQKSTDSTR
jgi:hypothetical protein